MTTQKVYGAWLDKKGNMIAVKEEGHIDAAIEILGLNKRKKEAFFSPLRLMFKLGYTRIVFLSEGYELEYYKTPNKKLKQWHDNASRIDKYKINPYYKYGYDNGNSTISDMLFG